MPDLSLAESSGYPRGDLVEHGDVLQSGKPQKPQPDACFLAGILKPTLKSRCHVSDRDLQ